MRRSALGLFFLFAATMGVTVGVIVSLYKVESVITSFLGASAMFGAAAIYGATTKRNLNSLGGFLFMGMVGVFVASIVNIWLGSSPVRLGDRPDRRRRLHRLHRV